MRRSFNVFWELLNFLNLSSSHVSNFKFSSKRSCVPQLLSPVSFCSLTLTLVTLVLHSLAVIVVSCFHASVLLCHPIALPWVSDIYPGFRICHVGSDRSQELGCVMISEFSAFVILYFDLKKTCGWNIDWFCWLLFLFFFFRFSGLLIFFKSNCTRYLCIYVYLNVQTAVCRLLYCVVCCALWADIFYLLETHRSTRRHYSTRRQIEIVKIKW